MRLNERELLTHAGKMSHQEAIEKAHCEYDKFHALTINSASQVERDFMEVLGVLEEMEKIKS